MKVLYLASTPSFNRCSSRRHADLLKIQEPSLDQACSGCSWPESLWSLAATFIIVVVVVDKLGAVFLVHEYTGVHLGVRLNPNVRNSATCTPRVLSVLQSKNTEEHA
eukprot:4138065-Amphidinium_carterae.1